MNELTIDDVKLEFSKLPTDKGGVCLALFDDWFGSNLELLQNRLNQLNIKIVFVKEN